MGIEVCQNNGASKAVIGDILGVLKNLVNHWPECMGIWYWGSLGQGD